MTRRSTSDGPSLPAPGDGSPVAPAPAGFGDASRGSTSDRNLTRRGDPTEFPFGTGNLQSNFRGYRDEQGASPLNPPDGLAEGSADAVVEAALEDVARRGPVPALRIVPPIDGGDAWEAPSADDRGRGRRPYQPCEYGQMAWREAVAASLRKEREWKLADEFAACGQSAYVTDCDACGATPARVCVQIGCGMRACPYCARKAAERVGALYDRALDHVDELLTTRVRGQIGALERRRERLRRRRSKLETKVVRLERRETDLEALALARAQLAKAGHEVRSVTARLATLRVWRTWHWKWATVTVRWDPYDPASYSIASLRQRVQVVAARAKALAEALSWHGCTATVARIELSPTGHVHAHVLHLGPWVPPEWINRQVWGDRWRFDDPQREGTIVVGEVVDTRSRAEKRASPRRERRVEAPTRERVPGQAQREARVDPRAALRETLKYSMKAPTPLRGDWVGGKRIPLIHPTLAARWILATRRAQLIRTYGLFRAALTAAKEQKHEPRHATRDVCAYCGEALPADTDTQAWRRVRTWEVAKAISERDRERSLAYGALHRSTWALVSRLETRPSAFAPLRKALRDEAREDAREIA